MAYGHKLSAVVFDFDGVIVNTEPLHFAAFREVLQAKGLTLKWEEYVSYYLGFDDRAVFKEVFKKGGRIIRGANLSKLILAKAQVFQRLVQEKGFRPFPGVVRLLKSLTHQVPLALCSGALKSDINPILGKLKFDRVFDVMVTAEDVLVSKPDPASYVLVLKRLKKAFPEEGISAERCVAIEDTPAGIHAARRAGFRVLAISNSYASTKLSAAEKIVPSLKDITKNDLVQLIDHSTDDTE